MLHWTSAIVIWRWLSSGFTEEIILLLAKEALRLTGSEKPLPGRWGSIELCSER